MAWSCWCFHKAISKSRLLSGNPYEFLRFAVFFFGKTWKVALFCLQFANKYNLYQNHHADQMTYRPNKKGVQFFSIIVFILGAVIVKKTNEENPSANGFIIRPPVYLGAGLILTGMIGIILIWSVSGRKSGKH
jgi:hypothetical protein